MTYPPLYILRHGQTVWNAQQRIQGSLDSPLTDLGRAQALQQHAILSDRDLTGFDAISSPQGRAVETARIALSGLFPHFDQDPLLCEIGVGIWEGKCRADLPVVTNATDSEDGALDLYQSAPGGEGFDRLCTRCKSFLGSLSRPSVLVTHGITSRMLRLVYLGREAGDLGSVDGGQGVVFHLSDGVQTKLSIGA